jgi:hypothetical protein
MIVVREDDSDEDDARQAQGDKDQPTSSVINLALTCQTVGSHSNLLRNVFIYSTIFDNIVFENRIATLMT